MKKVKTTKKIIKKETKKVVKVTKSTQPENEILMYLIRQYYQVQLHRLAFGNQIIKLKEQKKNSEILNGYFQKLQELEKDIAGNIKNIVSVHPMWDYMEGIKGIGPILGATLLATIDIRRAEHASSVWKYAGLAVGPDGRADGRKRGEKLSYNPFLKTICWKIGESFIKTKGEYRMIYDTSKKFYQKKFPKEVKDTKTKRVFYTKGHINNMARRRTVKLFLANMWAYWRELEELPVSEPFAHRIIQEPIKKKATYRRIKK